MFESEGGVTNDSNTLAKEEFEFRALSGWVLLGQVDVTVADVGSFFPTETERGLASRSLGCPVALLCPALDCSHRQCSALDAPSLSKTILFHPSISS